MSALGDADIQRLYETFRQLLKGEWSSWRQKYVEHVERVHSADYSEWQQPAFQQGLWESNAIAHVGMGTSVTVQGAYGDSKIVKSLFDARSHVPTVPLESRGAALETIYEETLSATQAYNKRRPKARLLRLLATMFPADVSCIVDEPRLWQLLPVLGIRPVKGNFVAQHPTLRQRLREVVGDAQSVSENVDQSIFTWFLWERCCKKPDDGAVVTDSTSMVATDKPTLSILPASVQRKGLTHVTENVPLLVAVVREAEQGISRSDLVAAIQREAPQLKAAGSASNIISQAQGGLALIGLQDGAYRPSARGLELLTNPDPAQVLQPLLIGRVFGIGHLLLALKAQPDGIEKKPLSEQLTSLIPTRKSSWSGGELIAWACESKLARQEGTRIYLTDDGATFADALPTNFGDDWKLQPPQELSTPSPHVGSDGINTSDTQEFKFVAAEWGLLKNRFDDGSSSSGLILPNGFLAELHAALHATNRKRFVLLSGLSGTGKTSIARGYAEAYCRALELPDIEARYAQVAVRPDWTDPTGLLGFVNSITDPPSFQAAESLRLLLAADADRARPYFLCLDEMNLARVEHYFAPFLSAMEGPTGTLALHGELDAVDNVQPRISWPTNLFIFGTVNMDESTHPFSDKVLDRAFTFEFWDVDLVEWENRKRAGGADEKILTQVASTLRALYSALEPVRRHFGYRTADEVLAYCTVGSVALPIHALLDSAILMKVLPRIRGDDSGPLGNALTELAAIATADEFPRTAKKIQRMADTLKLSGQTRFWS